MSGYVIEKGGLFYTGRRRLEDQWSTIENAKIYPRYGNAAMAVDGAPDENQLSIRDYDEPVRLRSEGK